MQETAATMAEDNNFSREDRRELITQSVKLDQLIKEFATLRDDTVKSHNKRIDDLEKVKDTLGAQIKTIIWVGGFLITVVQLAAEVLIHTYFSK
jgi:hypothetical protein